jgi:hypothetical protein
VTTPGSLLLLLVLVTALAVAVTGRPAVAAPGPSIAPCALGSAAPEHRGLFASALARAERRFAARVGHSPRRARALFAGGVAAHVYGLAPVAVSRTVQRFPLNQIVSIATLVDPSVRVVVLPNVDTTYTVGQIRLGADPLVLDVPDTAGRYYVIQLLDAYSNTFAYVGRRTTGTRAGAYAIVPPGWRGGLPTGVKRIQSPTPLVWLLGRTLVEDAADLPAVTSLMGGYRLTPLAEWTAGARRAPLVLSAFPASPSVPLPRGLDFFTALAEVLRSDPPPRADACALRAFARVGLGQGPVPGTGGPSLARRALLAAARWAPRLIERAELRANRSSARRNNGWLIGRSYVGDYGRNYLGRAVIAENALGANTPPETVYPLALTDAAGRPLNGRRRYAIRFPRGQLPPANAFWSLTAYDADRYLVPNAIDRYAVGDRTPGLVRGRDGSLTIYVQHRPPRGRAAANWLPVPRGRFRLALRIYEPRRSVLTGRWSPPPVRLHS